MTDKPKDGGPAFAHGNPEQGGDPGMSLRDYFAAAALTGMCANPLWNDDDYRQMAGHAFKSANAMLRERDND